MTDQDIQVAIHPAAEGGFWAEVEGVRGCITQAEDDTATLERLQDAHQIWSEVPAPAMPRSESGAPSNGVPSTVGEVAAWLSAAGWSCMRESEQHFAFVKGESGRRVTLPKRGDEALKEGYREALLALVSE